MWSSLEMLGLVRTEYIASHMLDYTMRRHMEQAVVGSVDLAKAI
jgi:hypothetical protein